MRFFLMCLLLSGVSFNLYSMESNHHVVYVQGYVGSFGVACKTGESNQLLLENKITLAQRALKTGLKIVVPSHLDNFMLDKNVLKAAKERDGQIAEVQKKCIRKLVFSDSHK